MMQAGVFAVWVKHAGNPHMAACLLMVPAYKTFCGQDWNPSLHPPLRAAYYTAQAVPQPNKLWGTMTGIIASKMACDRCVGASWETAMAGRLCLLGELPPYGQPLGPQVPLPLPMGLPPQQAQAPGPRVHEGVAR